METNRANTTHKAVLLAAAVAAGISATGASAATIFTWDSGASRATDWSTKQNWTPEFPSSGVSITMAAGDTARFTSATSAGGSNTGLTFSSNTAGAYTITPTVSTATNATLGGNATSSGTTPVTVTVLNHADGTFVLPGTGGADTVYSGSHGELWYPRTDIDADVTVADQGKSLNVDFGYVYADTYTNPYPVYAYFDLANVANAAGLHLAGIEFAEAGPVLGNWSLQVNTGAGVDPWVTLTSSNFASFADVAANSAEKMRVAFDNSADLTMFRPYDAFTAQWNLYFTDAVAFSGLGGYAGAGSFASWDVAYTLTINATATAVPIPASAWSGLALLGGLGLRQYRRSRRLRSAASTAD